MSEQRKYSSTELPSAQRELIARFVGPLEARGIGLGSILAETLEYL